ncbi:MAG: DNA polymerase IV [Planctomycetota bacterium]|nr:DNA polymerase IV [Planctomycetota bacterium]
MSPRMWPRAIAHVDLDQFYAAVEMLDFPELRGQPVIVGGLPGARGVVSTASYEARKFGVHSAMPSSQAARLCPHAIWRVPRMERYVEKSREVQAVFARYTDLIEPLSLDEAFLDLTGSQRLFGPAETIAWRIKDEILKETGLVASLGLAQNKSLAKIASDLKKPNALVVVPPGAKEAAEFLAPLPIGRLWGVGPKTEARLREWGLRTIGDLARCDTEFLMRRLGAAGAHDLQALARGEDDRPVVTAEAPQSISRENTFADDLQDDAALERELLAFAEDVAARLRAKGLQAGGVTLKVRFGDFTTLTRALQFEEPTDIAEALHAAGVRLLRTKVSRQGRGVRLIGLAATRLAPRGQAVATLFPDEKAVKQRRVAETLDRLRRRFGDDAVTRARLLEDRPRNTGTPTDTPRK